MIFLENAQVGFRDLAYLGTLKTDLCFYTAYAATAVHPTGAVIADQFGKRCGNQFSGIVLLNHLVDRAADTGHDFNAGGAEGLYGIGAATAGEYNGHISIRHEPGRLNPRTAKLIDVRVWIGVKFHGVQVYDQEIGTPPKTHRDKVIQCRT